MVKSVRKSHNIRLYVLAIIAVAVAGGLLAYLFATHRPPQASEQVSHQASTKDNAYASIPSSDIQRSEGEVDIQWNKDQSPVVALVHIDSIKGGRTYNPIFSQYGLPQTYGTMTIQTVYKGDVKPGTQVDYARLGGIVTYQEYWKSLNPQQQDKILHLNNGKQPAHKEYVQEKSAGDIDVETGKNYLAYLTPQTSKDGTYNQYLIAGLQYGLREVKTANGTLTVLNNDTHQWENLDSVIAD